MKKEDFMAWLKQNRENFEKRSAEIEKETKEGLERGDLWDPDVPGSWEKYETRNQEKAKKIIDEYLSGEKTLEEAEAALIGRGYGELAHDMLIEEESDISKLKRLKKNEPIGLGCHAVEKT